MKPKRYASFAVALFLVLGLAVSLVGCFGQGESTAGKVSTVAQVSTSDMEASPTGTTETGSTEENQELSTFKSKDPFIQQVTESTPASGTTPTDSSGTSTPVGPGTTSYTNPTTSPNTTYYTTTTKKYTTTTWWTTTTKPPTTSTTKPPTTTTTTEPHVHALKILSVEKVGDSPAVTFKVDNSIYKNKVVGNVVSTTWGQVQIVDISLSSKVVTLLHGSETVTLEVGQQIYE